MEIFMKNNHKVAAIVVTYNRKELLRECLEALKKQTMQVLDVLIIDNASTDGTYEFIEDLVQSDEMMKYINTGENLGGAGGFHFGLKEAYNRGYDYMWMMDDDTIPEPQALEALLKAHVKLKGNYGYLSSCALWTDGSYCTMNRQVADLDNCIHEYENIEKGLLRITRATFVSLFLKRSVVKKYGLPLKEYFIWGDDMEYSLRISRRLPCYFVTGSHVVHKMKSNVGSDLSIDEKERIPRYELAFRNDCHTAWANGLIYIINYYELVLYTFKKIVTSKSKYKLFRTWILVKGSVKGLFFHPKIEYLD